MAIGDVYRVIVKQTYLGEECLNVYHYKANDAASDASDLNVALSFDLLPPQREVQTPAVTIDSVETVNLDNPADFDIDAWSVQGLNPDNANFSSFAAWGFRLNRSSRDIRNGSKRICGVAEGDVSANVATGPILPKLDDLANAMGSDVTDPSGPYTWTPVIIRRNHPTLPDLTVDVASAQYVRLTTQNTRKA